MGVAQASLHARLSSAVKGAIIFAGLVAPLVSSCTATEHTPVDLQLDLRGEQPLSTDTLRICATNGVEREFAVGDGRVVVTGLSARVDPEITVDVLDQSGMVTRRYGPTVLIAEYTVVDAVSDEAKPCTGTGTVPALGDDSLILGVRFFTQDQI